MKIYEFKRGNGVWADYRLPDGVKATRTFEAKSKSELEKLIAKEPGRIAALAERTLSELPILAPQEKAVNRNFFGRLKWLFTGK